MPCHSQVQTHNYGYYVNTLGSGERRMAGRDQVLRTAHYEDFIMTFKYGDEGFPCRKTPRAAKVYVRCSDRYAGCWDSPLMQKENCTAAEHASGGCICGFQIVPPCEIYIYVYAHCGRRSGSLHYAYMNATDVTVYIFVSLVVTCILVQKSGWRSGGKSKVPQLRTEQVMHHGALSWFCSWFGFEDAPELRHSSTVDFDAEVNHDRTRTLPSPVHRFPSPWPPR